MSIIINERYPLSKDLDWEIVEHPIYDDQGQELNGYKQILHGNKGNLISVCRNTYTPVKNERLVQLCKKMIENTPFQLQGYASYNEGAKVMAYLKHENQKSFGGQKAEDFLVIGNSHDGSTAFFTGLTNRIYRCENMFSQSHQHNRIRHTLNNEQDLQLIEQTYDLYYNHQTGVYEMADKMLEFKVNPKLRTSFIEAVLKPKELKDKSTYFNNVKYKLETSIDREIAALGQNLFGLFNGVTHYTSNVMRQRKPVFGNPFNLANTFNQRAYQFCKNTIHTTPKKVLVTI